MNITVLGASGRTGTPPVAELLRRGHAVTALVRTPEKLGANRARVRVAVGSCADPAALDQLLEGAEAVVSALGPAQEDPTLHTETAEALIRAMPQHLGQPVRGHQRRRHRRARRPKGSAGQGHLVPDPEARRRGRGRQAGRVP